MITHLLDGVCWQVHPWCDMLALTHKQTMYFDLGSAQWQGEDGMHASHHRVLVGVSKDHHTAEILPCLPRQATGVPAPIWHQPWFLTLTFTLPPASHINMTTPEHAHLEHQPVPPLPQRQAAGIWGWHVARVNASNTMTLSACTSCGETPAPGLLGTFLSGDEMATAMQTSRCGEECLLQA
jgi:hypothetical protein